MANSIAELIRHLAENERAMEELMLALADEQASIVGMDLKRLNDSVGRKEDATQRLIGLQLVCSKLISRAGTELGCQDIRNLSSLVAVATSEKKDELHHLQQRQMRLASSLERQFGLNRKMLVNSIDMIQNSMAQFSRLIGGCDTYGVQGRINNGRTTGAVLCREV
jgi:hypothetical protein